MEIVSTLDKMNLMENDWWQQFSRIDFGSTVEGDLFIH